MPWRPLLQGAPAARAKAALARLLAPPGPRPWPRRRVPGPGLHLGEAGLAVAHAYLARARPAPAAPGRARRHLDRALAALETTELSGSFATGLPGIAWALAHLDRERLLPVDGSLVEALDEVLLGAVAGAAWEGDYEVHQGLAGIGAVALERLPRKAARRTLEHVVRHLHAGAIPLGRGLAWPTLDEGEGPPAYLIGLSHGVAGIAAFLARAWALGVAPSRSRRLLAGAVALLRGAELPAGAASRFPRVLVPGVPGEAFRSAWCHGDIGIASALLVAARAAGERSWERLAVRAARSVAARPPAESHVQDPTICHGAFGTAHLLNRMAQATGDPALRRGARRFLALGLKLVRDGAAGRARWREQGQPGLLIGDAGMALVLLAATTGVEPRWDRALSVDVSPN